MRWHEVEVADHEVEVAVAPRPMQQARRAGRGDTRDTSGDHASRVNDKHSQNVVDITCRLLLCC